MRFPDHLVFFVVAVFAQLECLADKENPFAKHLLPCILLARLTHYLDSFVKFAFAQCYYPSTTEMAVVGSKVFVHALTGIEHRLLCVVLCFGRQAILHSGAPTTSHD
jgi:hypothetical protein